VFPNLPFDADSFSKFQWLVVEQELPVNDPRPAARASPLLFNEIDIDHDFGRIKPHKGRFPSAVENAIKRFGSPVVQDEQFNACEGPQETGVARIPMGDGEIGEEPGGAGVEDGHVFSTRLVAERAGRASSFPGRRHRVPAAKTRFGTLLQLVLAAAIYGALETRAERQGISPGGRHRKANRERNP
jgi:hypothetical protein